MRLSHPRYNEYATCYLCGHKKYCLINGNQDYVCYSCDNKNFKGLKGIDNVQRRDNKQG